MIITSLKEPYLIQFYTGNLITDAFVHYYTVKLGSTTTAWTRTSIAIWNSGGIRETIPKGIHALNIV